MSHNERFGILCKHMTIRLLAMQSILFGPGINTNAQQIFSLSDCIRIATSENPKIREAETTAAIAVEANKGSAYDYIPTLAISNQNNLSNGRVLDPTTYQFLTNRTIFDMNATLGGSMTIFTGFGRVQSSRKAKLDLQSALLETERAKNDMALNVVAIFLNIVLDKESVDVCKRKIALLEEQEAAIGRRVEHGIATSGDLLNAQADITNARVELSVAVNNLSVDKISMCELLQIDDWEQFDISTADLEYAEVVPHYWDPQDVVNSASHLPQIRQAELAIDIVRRDIKIASSSFFPTIKLNAGYGSTFSSARTKPDMVEYDFFNQFSDNRSSYVTLSFNIPILSSISVSNAVRQKKMALTNAEHELTLAKLNLDKEVKQAIVNVNAAYEKYTLLATDVMKSEEALRQTCEKYAAGAATYYDYQAAVCNLYQAQTQILQSKYEYIFRTKIVEFYSCHPLSEK